MREVAVLCQRSSCERSLCCVRGRRVRGRCVVRGRRVEIRDHHFVGALYSVRGRPVRFYRFRGHSLIIGHRAWGRRFGISNLCYLSFSLILHDKCAAHV